MKYSHRAVVAPLILFFVLIDVFIVWDDVIRISVLGSRTWLWYIADALTIISTCLAAKMLWEASEEDH